MGLTSAVAAAAVCAVVLASVQPARAAVDLVEFYVTFGPDGVLITWVTGNELTTVGFNLYRAETVDLSSAAKLNEQMIEASGERTGEEYVYPDEGAARGVAYYYWLEVVDSGGNEVFGPEPQPTPTPTGDSTATRTPTATPTRTKTPTPTSTVDPTLTPYFAATVVPSFTPTGTPQSTPAPTTPPSASATVVPEQASSPTATTTGEALLTLTPDDAERGLTPSPTSAAVAVGSEDSAGGEEVVVADTGSAAPWWSSLRLQWPAIQLSTILLSISMMSLVGVLLLSLALVLLRRSSL